MLYILSILGLLIIISYFIRKRFIKDQRKWMDENDDRHTKEQIDYLNGKDNEIKMDYRGRKTESDWKIWFEDMLNENKNN